MPEYLYPGVFVEEIDSGNKPIEGVSTSTVGFLGIAERGPLAGVEQRGESGGTLLTSFTEFTRTFGGYVNDNGADRYLAYAVEGFFQNGGLRCYLTRVVRADAATASLAVGGMTVNAQGPGFTGNRIAVIVAHGSLFVAPGNPKVPANDFFKLTILYWSPKLDVPGLSGVTGTLVDPTDSNNKTNLDLRPPTLIEVYDNLTANKAASNYFLSAVNDASSLVTVDHTSAATIGPTPLTPLASGNDGNGALQLADFTDEPAADSNRKRGLAALADLDDISLLCCPDEFALGANAEIAQALVDQCELLRFRFAILQAPFSAGGPTANNPSVNSKYAAYYYPWLKIVNPVTGVLVPIPPGGHVAGIYARSDTVRGVAKDPANEPIRGIDSLQLQTNNQQQAILNPKGVNVLRYFKGQGNLVWGGRTTTHDPDWKYISVRRLFIFVEKSIQDATGWVVFEPNDAPLWARVVRSVSDFLTTLWKDRMLQGTTKEQAYFVRCDRTTMTQADIDNGRLIMVIGIAPVKPAEFVIFRIGQWTGGSDVTES